MDVLNDLVVTSVNEFATVAYKKGTELIVKNRKYSAVTFCMEGQRIYYQNGIEYSSDPEHVIFLPQGQEYKIYANKNGIYPVINFMCLDFPSDTILRIQLDSAESYIRDYEQMKKLFLSGKNKAAIMSMFYAMLHRISMNTQLHQSRLNPVIKYIEENYTTNDISNGLLAQLCNMSEVHFRKLFKDEFDKSPKQYILDMRIQRAKQLLRDGVFKINAVSEECGFSSEYHFSRIFKQKTGMSPTEYNKKNQIIY